MKNLTLIFTLVLLSIILPSCDTEEHVTRVTVKVSSKEIDESLYIKTSNWGLTGDNQITTISTNDNINHDKIENDEYYVVFGLEPFLYRQNMDSLILYSRGVIKVPKKFKTKWKIISRSVDNPTFIDLMINKKYNKPQ